MGRMTHGEINPTLDRLYRHMAWANQELLNRLKDLKPEEFLYTATNDEWTVGAIAHHLVRGAGNYVARLNEIPPSFSLEVPTNAEDVEKLADCVALYDAQLRHLSHQPEGMVTFVRDGRTIIRARSTILGQAIHHATEHRAQIGDRLSMHGIKVVNLDDLDVWSYSDAEGLGN